MCGGGRCSRRRQHAAEGVWRAGLGRQGRTAPIVEELAEEVLEVLRKADGQTAEGPAAAEEPVGKEPELPLPTPVTPVAALDRSEPPPQLSAPRVEPPTMIGESNIGPDGQVATSGAFSKDSAAEEGRQERAAAAPVLKRKAVGAFGGLMRRRAAPAAPPTSTEPRAGPQVVTDLEGARGDHVAAGGSGVAAAAGAEKQLSAQEAARRAASIQSSFVAPFTFAPREREESAGEAQPASDGAAPAGSAGVGPGVEGPGPRPMSGAEVRAALDGRDPSANRFAVLANHDGDAEMLSEGMPLLGCSARWLRVVDLGSLARLFFADIVLRQENLSCGSWQVCLQLGVDVGGVSDGVLCKDLNVK